MVKIMEFSDYIEDTDLTAEQQAEIKNWLTKYEKYYNFQDSGNFMNSVDQIAEDAMTQLAIDKSKKEAVSDYIDSLYDLSDGLSFVMAPGSDFQYTGIDQVQRFQY